MGKMKLTRIGILEPPFGGAGEKTPGPCNCLGCGVAVVWAIDDRYTKKEEIGSLFTAEPDIEGEAVLWFAVDRHDIPVDNVQWFRCIDPGIDYAGLRWSRHTTCGGAPAFLAAKGDQ